MKSTENKFYPSTMTIAGSDSGGGAGIQADLRTFAAFGVFGCSAITAVTSQNPCAVNRIDPLPPEAVACQITTVLDKIAIRTIKTGMLFNADIINAVCDTLENKGIPLIVDPVMIATSGACLLEKPAVKIMLERLFAMASWITPNIPEAELITGVQINGRKAMITAALACAEKWNCGCILKGGHLRSKSGVAADIVCYEGDLYELCSPLVEDCKASHGTGCTLSAALAAALALETPWEKALSMAKGFVYSSLAESVQIGDGIEAMYPPFESSWQGKAMLSKIEEI